MRRTAAGMGLAIVLAGAASAEAWRAEVEGTAVAACFAGTPARSGVPRCAGRAADGCAEAAPGRGTTPEIVACLSAERDAWDAILNREYGALIARLAEEDRRFGQEVRAADALREAQRAWIAFRDAECAFAWSVWQDGTIRGPAAASCLLERTARRALELRDALKP